MAAIRNILQSARPHQWIKNLFVLGPLLFGGRLTQPGAVASALTAFAVFCLVASASYILNDILDRASDSLHPRKRLRPIASGALSPARASLAAAALLLVGGLAAVALPPAFAAILALYALLGVSYSAWLRRIPILDVICIASGFVLRVEAGAVAAGVAASHWIVACTFLLALFLAMAKRRNEVLLLAGSSALHRPSLAGYSLEVLTITNGVLLGMTVLSYMLYTVAPDTVARFGTDALLYGVVFVLYGLLRYALLLQDLPDGGNVGRLLLQDRPLAGAVVLWCLYNVAVTYRHHWLPLVLPAGGGPG